MNTDRRSEVLYNLLLILITSSRLTKNPTPLFIMKWLKNLAQVEGRNANRIFPGNQLESSYMEDREGNMKRDLKRQN
jgi:hypothetical protein